jgi:hypothetical protein
VVDLWVVQEIEIGDQLGCREGREPDLALSNRPLRAWSRAKPSIGSNVCSGMDAAYTTQSSGGCPDGFAVTGRLGCSRLSLLIEEWFRVCPR